MFHVIHCNMSHTLVIHKSLISLPLGLLPDFLYCNNFVSYPFKILIKMKVKGMTVMTGDELFGKRNPVR